MKKAKNVSDILNIVKYDPPLPAQLNGIMLGHIPSFIPKTDEPRIQATRNVLTRNRGKRLYVTEKLDGTSATYYFRDGHFGVCSRNIELKPSNENTYWNVARKLNLDQVLDSKNIAIQGEIVGPGIAKNKYALNQHRLYVHGIYDLNNGSYFPYEQMIRTAEGLGLQTVPMLGVVRLDHTVDELLEMSNGMSAINPKVLREGIVLRSISEEIDPEIGRLSFKVVSPKFLLKSGASKYDQQ